MNRIKEILELKGVKQTWLADKLNKSYNMVNSYVQNRRQPSVEILYQIAKVLEVNVQELLYDTKKESQSSKVDLEFIKIPIVGTIACGSPIFAEENIEDYLEISKDLLKKNEMYFILVASGDSMNKSDINDGDLILINQQSTANDGDIVVALINDEATLKILKKKENLILLQPNSTNKKHKPIIASNQLRIQGVFKNNLTR